MIQVQQNYINKASLKYIKHIIQPNISPKPTSSLLGISHKPSIPLQPNPNQKEI